MSLTWPDPFKCKKLNQRLFETSSNPFGIASYTEKERITDFVGREKELIIFKDVLHTIFHKGVSRAVRLEGPGGVGKSTLFNFLKQSIEDERNDQTAELNFLLTNCDIFSAYIPKVEQIADFSDLWRQILLSLRGTFDKNIQGEISLPEYVMLRFIYQLLYYDPKNITNIIWNEKLPPTDLRSIKLRDIYDCLLDGGSTIVVLLQDYWKENKRKLRNHFAKQINGDKFNLTRMDNTFINDLFRVFDEDDNFLEEITEADASYFKTEKSIIDFFDKLKRYYTCSTGKIPIILIGMDDVAKGNNLVGEEYYKQLGNLFVTLRNTLHNILFVFISTTQDWADFDKALRNSTDLRSQISEFITKISLNQLTPEKTIQVFRNRMNKFWENYAAERPTIIPYYPFVDNMFAYAFRSQRRDLRKTIHFFKHYWNNFKYTKRVPELESYFACIREYYNSFGSTIDPKNLRPNDWNIIRNQFEKSPLFQNNSKRSSVIERGLEYAWKTIMNESGSDITLVRNNPVVKNLNGKTRKPDVLVEIRGNLGAEHRKRVEFQVKVYNKGSKVEFKRIESSLELFNENYTDMIYFIITGDGLDSRASSEVRKLEQQYPVRIRYSPLTMNQVNVLYLLGQYKELTGNELFEEENGIQNAYFLLQELLGQSVRDLIQSIINLPYRGECTVEVIPKVKPTIIVKSVKLDKFTDLGEKTPPVGEEILVPTIQTESPLQTEPISGNPPIETLKEPPYLKWLEEYSGYEDLKYELCALCNYLQTRETDKRYKNKFTSRTVLSKVISPDASLDKNSFSELIKKLLIEAFIQKDKSSYVLTETGIILYNRIKQNKFEC